MKTQSIRPDGSGPDDFGDGFSRLDLLRRGGLLAAGVAGAGALAAVSPGASEAKVSSSPIKKPEAIYQAWEERLNAADMKGMLALYEEHVTFVNPEGRLTHGYERSHIVSGNICLTSNHWRMTVKPAGGKTEHLKGGGVEVLRRGSDGSWRYVIDDASRIAVPG